MNYNAVDYIVAQYVWCSMYNAGQRNKRELCCERWYSAWNRKGNASMVPLYEHKTANREKRGKRLWGICQPNWRSLLKDQIKSVENKRACLIKLMRVDPLASLQAHTYDSCAPVCLSLLKVTIVTRIWTLFRSVVTLKTGLLLVLYFKRLVGIHDWFMKANCCILN